MTYFLLVLVVSAILTIAVSADSYHKDSHSYRNYHGNSNNNSDNNSVSKDVSDSYRCPITDSTNIVYSVVDGVGPASNIWVTDFLWWWKQADNTINYVALDANAMRNCALTDYKNLRVYINPGGDAYEQLASLGQEGTNSIKEFVNRKDSPSSYVGFCAGGYIASHDYLWESAYEGPGYYNYAENPPLSIFPHMVEGSIVDINDDQFADQMNSKFRTVNVSNGHTMLYYGGSTFGWNGANDYTSKSSYDYDPNVEVLVYYTDFYGYNSYNIPAAWKYGDNILLTSVHPEANNCTNQQDSDCPPAGTLSQLDIDRNRAWLANYINEVAETNFIVPDVEVEPSFNTTAPHDRYPTNLCYSNSNSNSESILFCDGFDTEEGKVPVGLSPQFQRNQTSYEKVFPWNTSYISYWYDNYYTSAYNGNGYAINVPQSSTLNTAAITTKPFHTRLCNSVSISYATIGSYTSLGYFKVEYSVDSTDDWQTLAIHNYATTTSKEWEHFSYNVQTIGNNNGLIRFTCAAGQYIYNFCALDSLYVLCNN